RALHLDGGEALARPDHEVDLVVALSPVVELQLAGRGGVRQMSPDRGLHETPPELPVRPYLLQALAPEGRHESRVQHLELRAGGLAACRVSRVLLEPGHEAGTRQQVEVVGERRGVARVLELT